MKSHAKVLDACKVETIIYVCKMRIKSDGAFESKVRINTSKILHAKKHPSPCLLPITRSEAVEYKLTNRVNFVPSEAHEIITRYLLTPSDAPVRVGVEIHFSSCEVFLKGEVEYKPGSRDEVLQKERQLVDCVYECAKLFGVDDLRECFARNFDSIISVHLDRIKSKAFCSLVDCDQEDFGKHMRLVTKWDGIRARIVFTSDGKLFFSDTNSGFYQIAVAEPPSFLLMHPNVIWQVEVMENPKLGKMALVIVDAAVVYGGAQYQTVDTKTTVTYLQQFQPQFQEAARRPFSHINGMDAYLYPQRFTGITAGGKPSILGAYPSWLPHDGVLLLSKNRMAKVKPPTVDVIIKYSFIIGESGAFWGQLDGSYAGIKDGIYEAVLDYNDNLIPLRVRNDRTHPSSERQWTEAKLINKLLRTLNSAAATATAAAAAAAHP